MLYVLCFLAFVGLILAAKDRNWLLVLANLSLFSSALCMLLSPFSLFYHSLGSVLLGIVAFLLHLFTTSSFKGARYMHIIAALPLFLVTALKVLHLPGIPLLKWTLLLAPVGLILFILKSRKLSSELLTLTYLACSSMWLLFVQYT